MRHDPCVACWQPGAWAPYRCEDLALCGHCAWLQVDRLLLALELPTYCRLRVSRFQDEASARRWHRSSFEVPGSWPDGQRPQVVMGETGDGSWLAVELAPVAEPAARPPYRSPTPP